jgi:ribonucleoside-triphosphate reductase
VTDTITNKIELPIVVVKRDGSVVPFDLARIKIAVDKCYDSLENRPFTPAARIVAGVESQVAYKYKSTDVPDVEQIQDIVEMTLVGYNEHKAARAYILYREDRAKDRVTQVPDEIKALFEADKKYFPTALQEFQYYDKYARWNWDTMRRETWYETVDRNVNYLRKLSDNKLKDSVYSRIHESILNHRSMPSMRSLAMAGEAAERNSMSIYNCSYLPVKDIESFSEAMLISMAGCGVGYSVETHNVREFPRIQRQTGDKIKYTVEDSSEGWAESLRFGISEWFAGRDVEFDYSWLRSKGMPLKVKGGRASGPEPLKFVHDFCRAKVISRQGSYLRTLDAHDIMCATGGAAVSGGVRRTAMIALFSWDDQEMRTCKDGTKLDNNPVRWNANNSAVWPSGVTMMEVIDQMVEMARNERGEPGIFSRDNANSTRPTRRAEAEFGSNPCGEIFLREYQLCNLSIAVARPDDGVVDLLDKVEIASIIGTIQSMATVFPGMRDEWKKNCVDERLLGVDITGQRDCAAVQDPTVLAKLKKHAVAVNKKYAKMLGINQSASVTCVKPSGNSSVFLDCSSGLHPRWAPFYLRRTRVSTATPLYQVLKASGVPMNPENGQDVVSANTYVVAWPVKAPEGSLTRKDLSAVDQCDFWAMNKIHWTEHNPSVTITYQPDELLAVTQWVWDHKDIIGGMAFLPADNAQYQQAPYEEITEDQYLKAIFDFPVVDFSLLYANELTDMTTAASELACMSGICEI